MISAVCISVLIHIHWLSLYREPGPCFPSALYSLTSPSGAPADLRYLRYGMLPPFYAVFLPLPTAHTSLPTLDPNLCLCLLTYQDTIPFSASPIPVGTGDLVYLPQASRETLLIYSVSHQKNCFASLLCDSVLGAGYTRVKRTVCLPTVSNHRASLGQW